MTPRLIFANQEFFYSVFKSGQERVEHPIARTAASLIVAAMIVITIFTVLFLLGLFTIRSGPPLH
jgi:hypothetical protein